MMQSDSSSRSVKRGDIVWVRVHFPHKWHPALVLSSRDNLGVQVTFSFSPNDAVSVSPATTYFVESEVVPFEEAFPSLITRRNVDAPPLHSALRLLGQRVLSGLRCHCLTGRAQAQQQSAREFDPVGVLGFVLDAAVSPWVESPRFAHAVRVVAQVHAFRRYSSMQHKKIYKQNKETGNFLFLIFFKWFLKWVLRSLDFYVLTIFPILFCEMGILIGVFDYYFVCWEIVKLAVILHSNRSETLVFDLNVYMLNAF